MKPPQLLTEREINTIRGKMSVGHASTAELQSVFGHLDMLEMALDKADEDDMLGTEGWRHFVGLPDAD